MVLIHAQETEDTPARHNSWQQNMVFDTDGFSKQGGSEQFDVDNTMLAMSTRLKSAIDDGLVQPKAARITTIESYTQRSAA